MVGSGPGSRSQWAVSCDQTHREAPQGCGWSLRMPALVLKNWVGLEGARGRGHPAIQVPRKAGVCSEPPCISPCHQRGRSKESRASNPDLPEVGVAKRGSAALVGRGTARGRGLRKEAWAAAAAPLPRAALSARREAAAFGGFAGLCSWDFGGASGTRALVSGARSGGAAPELAGAGGPPVLACEAPG